MWQESVVGNGTQVPSVMTEVIKVTKDMTTERIRDCNLFKHWDRVKQEASGLDDMVRVRKNIHKRENQCNKGVLTLDAALECALKRQSTR